MRGLEHVEVVCRLTIEIMEVFEHELNNMKVARPYVSDN